MEVAGVEEPHSTVASRAPGSEVTYAAAKIAANRQEVSLREETAAARLDVIGENKIALSDISFDCRNFKEHKNR